MDYRMWKGSVEANKNVIPLIKESMRTDGIRTSTPLQFIGFEAEGGTKFYLNDSKVAMEVPSSGNFITPYNGERGMKIWSLKFDEDFLGNIFYIV